MSAGGTLPRRRQRLAAIPTVVLLVALTAPIAAVAAAPSLKLSRVIHTNPFAGTSVRLHDGQIGRNALCFEHFDAFVKGFSIVRLRLPRHTRWLAHCDTSTFTG